MSFGKKDRDNKFSSFLTAFATHRTGLTAIDNDVTFAAITAIDFARSVSAAGNMLRLIFVRTAGAGDISYELWRKCDDSGSYTEWMKVADATAISATPKEVVHANLLAGQYRVKITVIGAGTWSVHESHSDERF